MENEGVLESGTGIVEPVVTDTIQPDPQPASPADDQKGKPPEGEAPPEETTEQQEARKQSKFQRRLDRQKSARVAAETELRITKERLASLEAQSRPVQADAAPKRDDFESLETYLEAVAAHKATQIVEGKLKTEREERQAQESKTRQNVGEAKVAQAWQEREINFQAATKDYQEAVQSYIEDEINALSDVARRAILESDVGPQVLYHLAKNPDEAERIADLSPARQVAELGKLEIKMPAVQRKTSEAPAPINPVRGGRSAPNGYSENMSDAEYHAWRKSNGAKWAR